MCGLSAILHFHTQAPCNCLAKFEVSEKLRLGRLSNRGPNIFNSSIHSFPSLDILFQASVLHIRGLSIVSQPLQGSNDSLVWNGEIFDGMKVIEPGENDTQALFNLLSKSDNDAGVYNIIRSIQGPWAFIFLQEKSKQLWFGRDIFGRRSLLWWQSEDPISKCKIIKISSVTGEEPNWNAIPAAGIYRLNIDQKFESVSFFPWSQSASGNCLKQLPYFPFPVNMCINIKPPISVTLNKSLPDTTNELFKQLTEIQFEPQIPECNTILFHRLLENHEFSKEIDSFLEVLNISVYKRVNNHTFICKNCENNVNAMCKHSTVAVLFSGGIDCTVLAILASKNLPSDLPIDLINVSFEHKVASQNKKKSSRPIDLKYTFDSPDRISSRESYEELKNVCPERQWNLVEVDITKENLQECRVKYIQGLIFPLSTVLDDSIGCATWFAARGIGKIKNNVQDYSDYCSPAKVVLVGMGADEQLGGYSRHRNKFQKDGWNGLIEEIQLEIDRISERNLARDDRMISDNGREARFPYLDENLVSFLNGLPVWMKMNLMLPRGVGEKIILRVLALKLGLKFAACLPKRAIQFGSRIAHLEAKQEKGSDICQRLDSTHI